MRFNKQDMDNWINKYGELKNAGWSLKEICKWFKKNCGLKDISSIRKNYDLLNRVDRVDIEMDENSLEAIAQAKADLLVNRKINVKERNIINSLADVTAFRNLITEKLDSYEWKTYKSSNIKIQKSKNNDGVYIISDEHFKGNCDIKHLNTIYDEIESDIKKEQYKNVELWYLGDGVDGLIHAGSLSSNDGAIIPSIQYTNILIERVNKIPQIKSIKFVCKSNHTQTRPLGTKRNELAKEDLGFTIANTLTWGLRKDIKLFVNDIIMFKYNGMDIALLHGHQGYCKSKAKMVEYWSGEYGVVPDMTIMGHYHTFKVNEYGNNKWLVVAPTAKQFNGDYEHENGFISTSQILKLEFKDRTPRFEIINIGR